jgi:hypothetical protein
MKSLIMCHWKEAREALDNPGREGQHLIKTASIYRYDRRLQFYLYCRLRMDILKIVQPDPVGERGDQVEKGILEKIKSIPIKTDAHGREGRASLSNLHIAVATLRDLHMQKDGNAGRIDSIQFDNDLVDMLQRQDQLNGKGRKLESAFQEVESEVSLAISTAKGTFVGENDRLPRILLYIRTSAAILHERSSREIERSKPPAVTSKPLATSYRARGHTSHSGLSMNLSEDYEVGHPRITEGAGDGSLDENSDFDVLVDESNLYPEALVHTALATTNAAIKEGKTGPHCTWCGSLTCPSNDGNQCSLVWVNNRTGVVVLSTRKFGMLKHTSGTAYEAALAEAREHGVLHGAAPKDLEEFTGLVDQSVVFYKDRDYQYQQSRAQTANPYPPRQDARQPGGYQNGSAYPPAQRAQYPQTGGGRMSNGNSPYAAFNPRNN